MNIPRDVVWNIACSYLLLKSAEQFDKDASLKSFEILCFESAVVVRW